MAFLNLKFQFIATCLALVDFFASSVCFYVISGEGTQINSTLCGIYLLCLAAPTFLLCGVVRNQPKAMMVYIVYNYLWNIVYAFFYMAFFLSVLSEPEKFIKEMSGETPNKNVVPLQITAFTSLFMMAVVIYSHFSRKILYKALGEMNKNHEDQIFL
uniref:NADH dehydrogenase subunit 6 n=1 Tax=Ditylenchus dipsaci TaxID=166011 RepID=A0A915ER95_9BILA